MLIAPVTKTAQMGYQKENQKHFAEPAKNTGKITGCAFN